MIPYGKQQIDQSDVDAVSRVLWSDCLTTGPEVDRFERDFAERVGARFAVAINSGTAALHLAMLVAGVGPGDRVVTSPITFLASANAAAFVGATPDFADIDPVTYTLSRDAVREQWRDDCKAVVAVHYAGQTADMPAISDWARSKGAVVIEDACHAVGGRFHHDNADWNVGGHPWADISTFSFHPVKSMTCGEGGMLVTDNEAFAQKARLLRNHGMAREPSHLSGLGSPDLDEVGPWYYEMQTLGFNYRITDLQCALGANQLCKLDQFLCRRREIVAMYNDAFDEVKHIFRPALREPADREITSWHLYTLRIDFERIDVSRSEMMNRLHSEFGVGTQVLYIPVYLQPWYRQRYGYGAGKCPIAESFYRQALSLPLYPSMTDDDVRTVVDAVKAICQS